MIYEYITNRSSEDKNGSLIVVRIYHLFKTFLCDCEWTGSIWNKT